MALTDEGKRTDPGRPDQAPRPGVQEILDTERREVPEYLRVNPWEDLGSEDLAVTRYTSRAFYDLEMEKLWPKVWLMACREEDVLDVGDTLVFDIGR